MSRQLFRNTLRPVVSATVLTVLFAFPCTIGLADTVGHKFSVRAFGVKLGELDVATQFSGTRYSGEFNFSVTGTARSIARIDVQISANGQDRDGRLMPRLYSERVTGPGRNSALRMRYRAGTPILSHDAPLTPTAVDPVTQKGTIDPATAFLIAMRPVPPADLCAVNLRLFDGLRATRLILGKPQPTGRGWVCQGRLIRVSGYSPNQLRAHPFFPLRIEYETDAEGVARFMRANITGTHGPVTLVRRP